MAELLTVESLLSLAGMSALIAILVQLLKRYLGEWRYTQLLAMGIGLVVGLVATWIVVGLSPRTVLDAVLLAIVAGATSSGFYELGSNLAGLAGKGDRA
jgi:hypothetical protein